MNHVAHSITEDGVMIVLRHSIGAPSSMRITELEAIRFARALLDDLDPDGATAASRTITIGRITLDPVEGEVRIDGQLIHLTGREFGVLHLLARHPGQMVGKERIMDSLYGGRDEPDMKIVDVFVCKLRNKLRKGGAERQIETVWGRGYRLVTEARDGAWEPPLLRTRPSSIQAAILARLANGSVPFVDLWATSPDAPQTTIRNAILTLKARGLLESIGEPRAAVYRLAQARAA